MENRYSNKSCLICSNNFSAYQNAKYCSEGCKKEGKKVANRLEYARKRNEPEYMERRRAKARAYCQLPERKAYLRKWRTQNAERCRRYALKHYYANPAKSQLKRERQKLRQWGLTVEAYEQLLTEQGGVCAICSRPCPSGRKLAVDHDHETGRVRGLLCGVCNRGLGYFKDDKGLLEAAVLYLAQ